MRADTSARIQARIGGWGVAVGTRSFHVTRRTCSNISFGVKCVMVGAFRHILGSGSDPSFGMKTTVCAFVVPQTCFVWAEGVAVGDTASLVTIHAETLSSVATAAGWIITPGADGVDQYPIVGVNFEWTRHAVVAFETIAFLVALGTIGLITPSSQRMGFEVVVVVGIHSIMPGGFEDFGSE